MVCGLPLFCPCVWPSGGIQSLYPEGRSRFVLALRLFVPADSSGKEGVRKTGRLVHAASGEVLLERVRWCESFGCKLLGLMFRRSLGPDEGLLLVEPRASRTASAIHMLFMAFPIAAIWLDDGFEVVDKALARPWRLAYVPARPARYILEASPRLLNHIEVGDKLAFEVLES